MENSSQIPISIPNLRDYNLADWYHERIEEHINEFAKDLAADEDLLATIVLADGRNIKATWFGYHNPNMIVVEGIDGADNDVKVLLPQTNIQILLTKIEKGKNQKRKILGFQQREDKSTNK